MTHVTIYQKPTCSTCRAVLQLVKDSGHPFTAVNYYDHPFTRDALTALLRKGNLRARDVLRTKADQYATLGLAAADPAPSDDDLINLMIQHPDLLQRPLVEHADTVILARPPDTVKAILATAKA